MSNENVKIRCDFFERENCLLKLGKSTDLNPKLSYWIAKLMSKIQAEGTIYNEQKSKLLNKYCDHDNEGQPVMVGPNQYSVKENALEFGRAMQELFEVEIDLGMNKIDLKLEQIPQGILSPIDMMELDKFFNIIEE